MIALVILGVILCLLALLLFLPLTVDLVFDSQLVLKVRYASITIFDSEKKVILKKSKKHQKKDNNDQASKKQGFIKRIYNQKGLLGTVKYFCELLELLLKKLWRVAKRFKFTRFKLDFTVATLDAAKTAIEYGKICSAMYPVLSLLQSIVKFKPQQVNINADFDKNNFEFKASVMVTTRLFYWLVAALSAAVEFLKLQRKEREKYERKQH